MTTGGYRLVVAATPERSLARLPEAVAAAVVELMVGPLVEALRRLGHPLQRELGGLWSHVAVPTGSSLTSTMARARSGCFESTIAPTPTGNAEP